MPFTGDTFAHLFDWEKDPQRQEKIINARLEAEFDGIDTGLSTAKALTTSSQTQRIFARKTAGAGSYEECTLSEVLDFIGSAAQGDILYRGAASWARLAAGTAGKLLKTNGSGADPSWGYPEMVFKTSGESITSSTTLQDDNDLFFAMPASVSASFLLFMKFVEETTTTADLKVGFTVPSGGSGTLVPINGIKVNESDSIVLQSGINPGGSSIAFGSATSSRYAMMFGEVGTSDAGNVQIQWAQNTSSANQMIVQGGLIIVWRQ